MNNLNEHEQFKTGMTGKKVSVKSFAEVFACCDKISHQ